MTSDSLGVDAELLLRECCTTGDFSYSSKGMEPFCVTLDLRECGALFGSEAGWAMLEFEVLCVGCSKVGVWSGDV